MTDYEDLQKRCQRGAMNLNEANNLLAECYRMLGRLGAESESLCKVLISIRDTSDDWRACEKAADALVDMSKEG
jgi:hypothetical protein